MLGWSNIDIWNKQSQSAEADGLCDRVECSDNELGVDIEYVNADITSTRLP